jgi:glycosyltransferase involved in cell wall biosynthesis
MTADNKIPRVSIGMAVYNGERFLAHTLDSLLAQTYSDFELIICDNCSSDRTEEICRAYVAKDARIRYHRNAANIGVAKNFNLSYTLSRGELFKYAAADDLCAPTLIEEAVAVLDRRPEVVLCYAKTRLIDEWDNPIRDNDDKLDLPFDTPHKRLSYLLWHIWLCNPVFGVMRSKAVRQTGLYGTYPGSDNVFLAELALHGRFVELPETLFFRRMFEQSTVKYPSLYERMEMFRPGEVSRWPFPNWELFLGHLAAIHRAPLSMTERVQCYLRMNIWLKRWGKNLWSDITYHLARLPRRAEVSSGGA